jgi:Na+/proline symporter
MLAPYMLVLVMSILMVATTAIGIQCYNDNQKPEDTNKRFLISMLVVSIISLFASAFGIYLSK